MLSVHEYVIVTVHDNLHPRAFKFDGPKVSRVRTKPAVEKYTKYTGKVPLVTVHLQVAASTHVIIVRYLWCTPLLSVLIKVQSLALWHASPVTADMG